ncbi:hypothetical protein FACS189415_1200 [Bacteroidia bacterium]|nr:hypothetical protein FACS189415_1200 [Bacteroidia bacterium]
MAIIYLNPGHGGKDPGALLGDRREKDDVLRLGLAVKPLLEAAGHTVIMSRTDDTYTSVADIAKNANACGADLFIALHRNAGGGTGNECLIVSCASAMSRQMATAIQARICAIAGRDRGVKVQDTRTAVLKNTRMPATTVELGFIDNLGDNALFDTYFDAYAQAVANGIMDVAGDVDAASAQRLGWTLERYLKRGSRGEDVRRAQQALVAEGIDIGAVDGIFGERTRAGVRTYQQRKGLGVDGIVGPKTVAAMGGVWKG